MQLLQVGNKSVNVDAVLWVEVTGTPGDGDAPPSDDLAATLVVTSGQVLEFKGAEAQTVCDWLGNQSQAEAKPKASKKGRAEAHHSAA